MTAISRTHRTNPIPMDRRELYKPGKDNLSSRLDGVDSLCSVILFSFFFVSILYSFV